VYEARNRTRRRRSDRDLIIELGEACHSDQCWVFFRLGRELGEKLSLKFVLELGAVLIRTKLGTTLGASLKSIETRNRAGSVLSKITIAAFVQE
jgi:hypothetical protein